MTREREQREMAKRMFLDWMAACSEDDLPDWPSDKLVSTMGRQFYDDAGLALDAMDRAEAEKKKEGRDMIRTVLKQDVEKGLNHLAKLAKQIADEHGFGGKSVPEDVVLMHSELSELLEDYRDGRKPGEMFYEDRDGTLHGEMWPEGYSPDVPVSERGIGPRKPVGIPSELADVVIRALHFAADHNINIETAVREKMTYNAHRPFKHGGKLL